MILYYGFVVNETLDPPPLMTMNTMIVNIDELVKKRRDVKYQNQIKVQFNIQATALLVIHCI